jgi:hypothetical protein
VLRYNSFDYVYGVPSENFGYRLRFPPNTLVPNGKFSSLCLNPYDKKMEPANMEPEPVPEPVPEPEPVPKQKKSYFALFCNFITSKCKFFM